LETSRDLLSILEEPYPRFVSDLAGGLMGEQAASRTATPAGASVLVSVIRLSAGKEHGSADTLPSCLLGSTAPMRRVCCTNINASIWSEKSRYVLGCVFNVSVLRVQQAGKSLCEEIARFIVSKCARLPT
jgi:hypothetical protein